MVIVLFAIVVLSFVFEVLKRRKPRGRYAWQRSHKPPVQTAPCPSSRRIKPAWAIDAVVELKAACPKAGVRTIAALFNQAHGPSVTVCKSWVDKRLREHALRVIEARRHWRRMNLGRRRSMRLGGWT